MHLDIEVAADISTVAADVRNQGATVLLATCADSNQASTLQEALKKPGFGTPTRGDGEKGRSTPEEYQEEYIASRDGPIVIAGRKSMVKTISTVQGIEAALEGVRLFIVQLDVIVSVDDVLHMRVATIATNSTVVEREKKGSEALLPFWTHVVEELNKHSVRVLVYKDSEDGFRRLLLKKMQYTYISNVCGGIKPSFFVLGPVKNTKVQNQQGAVIQSVAPTQKDDPTKKWASISFLKLKECKTRIEKSTRTFVHLGSKVCRRTETARAKRVETRNERWKKQHCKQRP